MDSEWLGCLLGVETKVNATSLGSTNNDATEESRRRWNERSPTHAHLRIDSFDHGEHLLTALAIVALFIKCLVIRSVLSKVTPYVFKGWVK